MFAVVGAGRMSQFEICEVDACGTISGDVRKKTMGHIIFGSKEGLNWKINFEN